MAVEVDEETGAGTDRGGDAEEAQSCGWPKCA